MALLIMDNGKMTIHMGRVPGLRGMLNMLVGGKMVYGTVKVQ
jgi:hypothetical protein